VFVLLVDLLLALSVPCGVGHWTGACALLAPLTEPTPDLYQTFAEMAFFSFCRRLILDVAIPNARLITTLVVVFEFAVGVLTLGSGKVVRRGLIGTASWMVFICPAMGCTRYGAWHS
jgi:hypothetical protein